MCCCCLQKTQQQLTLCLPPSFTPKKTTTTKTLKPNKKSFKQFPPGHYYSSKTGEFVRYYNPQFYLDFEAKPEMIVPSTPVDLPALRAAFETAVKKRLMSDVPFGVLLSGGLDSSLVAAVAARAIAAGGGTVWGKQLHSFCVGLPGSPDLVAARGVAQFLGTDHHEFTFTVQEGIDAISDVIYHVETYDVTTIRARLVMMLVFVLCFVCVSCVCVGRGSCARAAPCLHHTSTSSSTQQQQHQTTTKPNTTQQQKSLARRCS